jgi:hypothetical protein
MVEQKPSKLMTRVRFPSPAPTDYEPEMPVSNDVKAVASPLSEVSDTGVRSTFMNLSSVPENLDEIFKGNTWANVRFKFSDEPSES